MLLTFIYYFKSILSINDIETLLSPITEQYFHTDSELNITRIYDEVCAFEKERTHTLQEDIKNAFEMSEKTFADVDENDREFLHFFSFLCMLSLDVYVKKQIIEKSIDVMLEAQEKPEKEKKDKKK